MVPLTSLWMPILLSVVIVFFASFLMHMVLTYHHRDWGTVPKQDEVMNALRPFNIPPGDYMLPCGGGPESMKDPAFLAKMNAGPVVLMTVRPNGMPSLARPLVQWVLFSLFVTIVAAYLAGRALGPTADYLEVFRFAGTVAFAGYSFAYIPYAIWFGRSWSTTIKEIIDGLVYALLTAGTFGWLWPR